MTHDRNMVIISINIQYSGYLSVLWSRPRGDTPISKKNDIEASLFNFSLWLEYSDYKRKYSSLDRIDFHYVCLNLTITVTNSKT